MFSQKLAEEKMSYWIALESPTLDSSSFILLAVAIIKKTLNDKLKESDKATILNKFIHNDIDESIKLIETVCQEHKELRESKLMAHIEKRKFTLCDNPLKNLSRRLFESSFTSNLWNSLGQNEFKSLEKLATIIKDMSPHLNPAEQIQSLENVESLMITMRDFGDKHKEVVKMESSIRKDSLLSGQKDRGKVKEEKTFSCNPGILKSYNPCLYHLVKDNAEKGRLVDMFQIDEKKRGFSFTNKQVPFVNSVSGTVFTLVSVLFFYMTKHKHTDHLSDDVNNILKSFLAFAGKNGYHSLAEMLCVIKSQEVTTLLKPFGVIFNFDFSQDIADRAYRDAIDYTKKLSLQDLIHGQIVRNNFLN